ncbi:MAG TPA: enoyl-CoA hydratase/isomerase family protein [Thermoleophilaceae bacterium]|nr:enoyl-CoA hydratase/isomerase family protein [Thermoleophilaceae bacterium]
MSSAVSVQRDRAVAVVRLEDAAGGNALTPALLEALASEVAALDTDEEVRCIVIAGTSGAFATGGGALNDELSRRLWDGLAACRTPTVAAVSGYALDRGLELALLCDMVVASETAELGLPEITVGLSPGGGATQRLARVLGRHRAMELVLTGRRIDSLEATRLGLVNQVAGTRDWLKRAVELAEVVARRPPGAVALAKRAVLAAEETHLHEGLAEEQRLHRRAVEGEEHTAAMRALAERQAGKPVE